jgi:hypothetical protein
MIIFILFYFISPGTPKLLLHVSKLGGFVVVMGIFVGIVFHKYLLKMCFAPQLGMGGRVCVCFVSFFYLDLIIFFSFLLFLHTLDLSLLGY